MADATSALLEWPMAVAPEPSAPPEAGTVLNSRQLKARAVQLQIDPEFRDVLPESSVASRAALHANLLAHGGCTNFILVWAGTDILIDGHHRYPICQQHDLDIWLGEIAMVDRAAVIEWIRQFQLAGRDLTGVAASCVRGEAYNARKGTRGGDYTSARAKGHDVPLLDAAQQVGEAFGVSDRTIKRDGRLAECVAWIAANCGAEAQRALLSADHKVTHNGVVRLAKQDAETQRKAIQALIRNKTLPRAEKNTADTIRLPRPMEDMIPALIRLLGVGEAETFHQLFAHALEKTKDQPKVMGNE